MDWKIPGTKTQKRKVYGESLWFLIFPPPPFAGINIVILFLGWQIE